MEKIVISLFIACYLFHFSKSNLIVVNLDSGEESNDKNLISSYLKDLAETMSTTYHQYSETSKTSETIDVPKKTQIEMRLGDEAFNSVIDTLRFYNKKVYLSTFIKANIDSSIIPQNYYEGYSNIKERYFDIGNEYPNNFSDYDVTCEYNNKVPTLNNKSLSDFNYTNVVASARFNFGIDSNNYLKIFTFDKSHNIIEYTLSTYGINSRDQGYNVEFSKLILADPVFTDDQMLFAITSDYKIYIYLIKDTSKILSMSFLTTIEDNSDGIIQASYNKNYYFILTESGLKYYLRTDISNVSTKEGNYKDFLVNNRTVYLMDTNGFDIYDTTHMETFGAYSSFTFNHKHLSKFDYVLYDNTNRKSSYFIGIIVDNNPQNGVYEILIELVANGQYETLPTFNHVFVTNNSISVDNIATDKYSYFTYILDNNKLYLLTRSVPIFQIGYSYLLSLHTNNPQSISIIARNDYIEGIENSANYFRDILIYEGDSNKRLITELNRTNPNLICSVKKSGIMYEFLAFRDDCSNYNSYSQWEIRQCIRKMYYVFNIETTSDKIKRIGIWIGVVLIIIVIIIVISYVVCCMFKRKRKVFENINSQNTDANQKKIVEIAEKVEI